MKTLKTLLVALSFLPACGGQLVEFAKDAAADGGTKDTRMIDGATPDAAGTSDARNPDMAMDGANPDAANRDGANPDTANRDGANPDARTGDARDAAALDGPGTDASNPDRGNVDATGPDAANPAAPMVVSTSPAGGAVNVSIAKNPTATFSEPMDPATVNGTTFTLKDGLTPVAGMVTYAVAGMTGTFTPTTDLLPNKMYTATISTGAKDLSGNPLANDFTWSFTTSACGQAPVALRSAGNFVVLAGSTVTSTGPSSVTGDLGVSPGTAVTGFPPGTVVGTQHAGDPTAAQAQADLTTAYNDAAGRTLCPVTVAGNLGGMTLAPGLYKSTSSLEISSDDLTLDAQGDPDAVFIFQMASTFTTTSGRQVILSGGAKAANVFWQVGTSATLGSTSAMQGTIMADQAITMNTGATLTGRVLARIAAVALDSNTIVKPAP